MALVKQRAALALLLGACLPLLRATELVESDLQQAKANPIRKVVTMLQTMQKKVEEEGEKEKELYEKFQCYCKTGKSDLEESIASSEAKSPAVGSEIEKAEALKVQLDGELKQHQSDRESAKASMAQATSIRQKEASAYAGTATELHTNIGALEKAIRAVETGMAGGFLQTKAAKMIQSYVVGQAEMSDFDRQIIMSFLSGTQDSEYSPKSGQITGILHQIHEEMSKSLADATAEEESAITDHGALMAAKSKEVGAHTKAIEEKSARTGETAVKIVELKNDLSDTEEALLNDKKFLQELESGCDTKATEWAERQQTRSEELIALSETIKLLNDDDALELFKKAVPTSLVQLSGNVGYMRSSALKAVRQARDSATLAVRPGFDFIALALQGKTAGFEKVIKMIDGMVEVLKKEQVDDDSKKEYCGTQLDLADDKKKVLETSVSDEEAAIASADESIATLKEEIEKLKAGITELDKSVADATDTRKKEHAEFIELLALDNQAKELLGVAKNRLAKFYSPNMYMAPPKKELTEEEKIYQTVVEPSFVQTVVATHRGRHSEAPPPPPETFGAYSSKSQESTSVVAMIDMIIKDLDKELTEAETGEKEAQKDYEAMMADAKVKRASDSKAMSGKESAKANLEAESQTHKDAKASSTKELASQTEYIHGLHAECDWLLEHHQVRKDARASEMDSLKNAKSVLAGADYSLMQVSRHGNLRGA
jgi:septal ring factor EnvC (AmiA/AmiB activator)